MMVIVKVEVGFSRVSCSTVKEQDFSEKYDFFFKGKQGVYRGVSKMPITGDYSCYRLEKIYGYRFPSFRYNDYIDFSQKETGVKI